MANDPTLTLPEIQQVMRHAHATPTQRCMPPRLDELIDKLHDDLVARRTRADADGWLGEIEGIDVTLTFLRDKRSQPNSPTPGRSFRSASQRA